MNKINILGLIILCLSTSCKQNKSSSENAPADTTKIFPYKDLLLEDIKDVNETPYFIYAKSEVTNQKRDSTAITLTEFNSLTENFIKKDISTEQLHANYKESTFHDLSTKSITITYTAIHDTTSLHDVIILLNDTDNKLSHLYFINIIHQGDSTIMEKCMWNTHHNFQITKIIQHPNLPNIEKKLKIVWN